ncbi:hypothetical protein D3C84_641720 [compost metagenome]
MALHTPDARRTPAPQFPGAGFRIGHGADGRPVPATAVLCLHTPGSADADTVDVFPGIRKSRLHLRADHRVEPRPVVHETPVVAAAGACRSGGAVTQALSAGSGGRAAGSGDDDPNYQRNRHEQRHRDRRSRGRRTGCYVRSGGFIVAHRQGPQSRRGVWRSL